MLLRRCRRRCTPVAKPGRGSELPVRWQVGHVLRSVGELLLRVERSGRLLKRCRWWAVRGAGRAVGVRPELERACPRVGDGRQRWWWSRSR